MEAEARATLAAMGTEIEKAVDTILNAAESCLRDIGAARAGQALDLDRAEQALCAILEACAFQDLTGQRLSNLNGMIGALPIHDRAGDPLLNGPALAGRGVDQTMADHLLDQTPGSAPATI